ncbi:hypothetical protein [Microbulbifer sp. SAOS-129_SWC]|uniref:hypothetical protein n=1 Tax=Microbulbifer sp. SAOS-129_SWC TaxID=3145235 RepID=UPI0032173465
MKKYRLIALLFSLLPGLLIADDWRQGENLVTPYKPAENQWELLRKDTPDERGMMWRSKQYGFNDSYVVTVYPGLTKSLISMRTLNDAPGKKSCTKRFKSIDLQPIANRNYPSLFWRTECETGQGFKAQMINLLIQGKDSFYHIRKVWRGDEVKPDVSTWVSRLAGIYVCDTRDETKACPTDYKKVNDF